VSFSLSFSLSLRLFFVTKLFGFAVHIAALLSCKTACFIRARTQKIELHPFGGSYETQTAERMRLIVDYIALVCCVAVAVAEYWKVNGGERGGFFFGFFHQTMNIAEPATRFVRARSRIFEIQSVGGFHSMQLANAVQNLASWLSYLLMFVSYMTAKCLLFSLVEPL
jgi:hypothetical protein